MDCKRLILRALMLVLVTTMASALAAPITYNIDRDFAYSATSDPTDPDPALLITGTWTLTPGDNISLSIPELVNWDVDLTADIIDLAGLDLYELGVEGKHLVPSEGLTFGASLGLANVEPLPRAGTITSVFDHDGIPEGWLFHCNINTLGTMNFEIRAAHEGINPSVPDAGSTSMLLGAALAGLALLRRKLY